MKEFTQRVLLLNNESNNMKITLENNINKPFSANEISQLTRKANIIPDRYFGLALLINLFVLVAALYSQSGTQLFLTKKLFIFFLVTLPTAYAASRYMQDKLIEIHDRLCPVNISFEGKNYKLKDLNDTFKPISQKDSKKLIELAKKNEDVQVYLKMVGNIRSIYIFEIELLTNFLHCKKKRPNK